MGKKTKTPDPMEGIGVAQAEYNVNKQNALDTTAMNRPNQSNQFGNLTWTQDPTTGQWTQNVSLNDQQQNIFNQQQGNQQQIANMGGGMLSGFDTSQMDFSNAPNMPSGVADYSKYGMPNVADYASLGAMPQVGQYSQQATDLYNQLMQPQLDRQRAAKEAQMAAMGLSLGSGNAWNNEQFNLNDAANRSSLMGAQAGINQGNTMFNQALAGRQQGANELTNQFNQGMGIRQQGVNEANNNWMQQMGLHQQGISDIVGERQANLGQLQGLLGLGQSMNTPQFENFTPATNTPNLNVSGIANQAALDKTNAANADSANKQKTASQAASIAASAAIAMGF